MRAKELCARLRQDLHDEDGVRYTSPMLLTWLSDAQRSVVLLRPDAGAVVRVVDLAAGSTLQRLPEDGVRFLGVIRNIYGQGEETLPGRAVSLTTLEALNAGAPLWHEIRGQKTGCGLSTLIYEYAPDEHTPTVYWVSPPPAQGVRVEIKYAARPQELSSENDPLAVLPTFAEPLREYALYRAYSRNDQPVDFQGRAQQHLQLFYTALGEEQKARMVTSPLNALGKG